MALQICHAAEKNLNSQHVHSRNTASTNCIMMYVINISLENSSHVPSIFILFLNFLRQTLIRYAFLYDSMIFFLYTGEAHTSWYWGDHARQEIDPGLQYAGHRYKPSSLSPQAQDYYFIAITSVNKCRIMIWRRPKMLIILALADGVDNMNRHYSRIC